MTNTSGLAAPVNRTVPLNKRQAFIQEAAELPSFGVTNADLSAVYRLADGSWTHAGGPILPVQDLRRIGGKVQIITAGGGTFSLN